MRRISIVIKLILPLLFLAGGFCFGQADTTMYRQVKYYLAPSLIFDSTFKFVLPKPKPTIVIIRDTIRIHDTVWVIKKDTVYYCPPETNELAWSKAKGQGLTFSDYIAQCQSKNLIALIDVDVAPSKMVTIQGNFEMTSLPGIRITNILPGTLFTLGKGLHKFHDLHFIQTDSLAGTIFTSYLPPTGQLPIEFYDSIKNVIVEGGMSTYVSNRGIFSTSSFTNCNFKNRHVNITVFGQDGNTKRIYMDSVNLWSTSRHNCYVHPNVSILAKRVHSMMVGLNSVTWHGFSSGGGEEGKGVRDSSEYQIFEYCTSANNQYRWQIPQPYTLRQSNGDSIVRPVIFRNCNLALYEIPIPLTTATNTNFQYGPFKGNCTGCSGTFRPQSGSIIDTSNITAADHQEQGFITYKRSYVKEMTCNKNTTGLPLKIWLEATTVKAASLPGATDLKVYLAEGSTIGSLWGFVFPPGSIVEVPDIR